MSLFESQCHALCFTIHLCCILFFCHVYWIVIRSLIEPSPSLQVAISSPLLKMSTHVTFFLHIICQWILCIYCIPFFKNIIKISVSSFTSSYKFLLLYHIKKEWKQRIIYSLKNKQIFVLWISYIANNQMFKPLC